MTEKCKYCGIEYHPMTIWTHKEKPFIYVCQLRYVMEPQFEIILTDECEKKATEDGYTKRLDLTPRR